MNHRQGLVGLFALSLCVAAQGCSKAESALGNDFVSTMRGSGGAKAYRFVTIYDKEVQSTGTKILAYDVASTASVSKAKAGKLRNIVLDSSSYRWGRTRGKLFAPQVCIRYTHGKNTADVLMDFANDQWAFYYNGKEVLRDEYGPARSQVVALVKQIFPGDDQIE